MSLGTICLAANLLFKADFKNYWKRWKTNFVFWFVFLLLIMHLVGLLYTENLEYAFGDLRSKLPLFVIPIALIAYPIKKNLFDYILGAFLLSLVITSIINYSYMVDYSFEDYRTFSLFGSHIRYSLLIVMGIAVSLYLGLKHKKIMVLFLLLIIWLGLYTINSQVLSGLISIFFLITGIALFFVSLLKNKTLQFSLFAFVGIFFIVVSMGVFRFITPKSDTLNFLELPTHSKGGEPYFNDTLTLWFENQYHIRSLIADGELEKAWNERSEIDFYEKMPNGYEIRSTLHRYMTSKNLPKDREGMGKMTDIDIKNVENGIYTILDTEPPIKRHLLKLRNELYQYSVGGNPNGNSLLQRFEHWKAAKEIIKGNWILGIGTGDVQDAFDKEYERVDSRLTPEHRNRAHNEFLTFWISFGILGFVIFTGFWIIYLIQNIRWRNLIGIGFCFVAIASFLSEDTIETQQGVTFIALFLGLAEMLNMWQRQKGD